MARWRLTQPHYFNTIPPTKYRYEETDRDTGERNVAEFDVCRHVDPNNPRDCRSQGECIACNDPKLAQRGDWVFTGDPTPDMQPIDSEAEEISASFAEKWKGPMSEEAFPSTGGFGGALLRQFEAQLVEAMKNGPTINPISGKGVDPADFAKLQEQVAQLMGRNAELEAKVAEPKTAGSRR